MPGSGRIGMSPEQMNSCATEVRGQRDAFEQVITAMTSIINGLVADWEGEASASYEMQFEELKPSFEKMRTLLDTMATQLDQTAQAYVDFDAERAASFRIG